MAISIDNLDHSLNLLAQRMEMLECPPLELVVCGGSGLIALGVIRRNTKDVDILAKIAPDLGIVDPNPLPESFFKAAEDVGEILKLPKGWINTGPSDQVKAGLPIGFSDRLTKRSYGPRLTIHYVGRLDQIHLKLFAAVDQGPGKHVADLKKLAPTSEEVLTASRWVLTQDDGEAFKPVYLDMLKNIGFSDVTGQL